MKIRKIGGWPSSWETLARSTAREFSLCWYEGGIPSGKSTVSGTSAWRLSRNRVPTIRDGTLQIRVNWKIRKDASQSHGAVLIAFLDRESVIENEAASLPL